MRLSNYKPQLQVISKTRFGLTTACVSLSNLVFGYFAHLGLKNMILVSNIPAASNTLRVSLIVSGAMTILASALSACMIKGALEDEIFDLKLSIKSSQEIRAFIDTKITAKFPEIVTDITPEQKILIQKEMMFQDNERILLRMTTNTITKLAQDDKNKLTLKQSIDAAEQLFRKLEKDFKYGRPKEVPDEQQYKISQNNLQQYIKECRARYKNELLPAQKRGNADELVNIIVENLQNIHDQLTTLQSIAPKLIDQNLVEQHRADQKQIRDRQQYKGHLTTALSNIGTSRRYESATFSYVLKSVAATHLLAATSAYFFGVESTASKAVIGVIYLAYGMIEAKSMDSILANYKTSLKDAITNHVRDYQAPAR